MSPMSTDGMNPTDFDHTSTKLTKDMAQLFNNLGGKLKFYEHLKNTKLYM